MNKRKIASLSVSVVGLGCNNFGWRIDEEGSVRVVDAAIDAGVNFFDTADVYGKAKSEMFLGRALGKRRGQVVIATKFGMKVDEQRQGAKPAYVRQAVEESLKRLGTDYIDLYQLHRPDPQTPIADTLGALNELVRAGKVRQIGCSQFSADQLRQADGAVAAGAARFVSIQNEYNLLHLEPEKQGVLEECRRQKVGFIPYFPLASGLLTGKYRRGRPLPAGARIEPGGRFEKLLTERNWGVVESLIEFAQTHGHTILELAFSWLLSRPGVASVIAGATSAEQIRANAAAPAWALGPEELAAVGRIIE